jgi:S-DNA-T family DNA segregation ATPase FtsK/SpoIIIE
MSEAGSLPPFQEGAASLPPGNPWEEQPEDYTGLPPGYDKRCVGNALDQYALLLQAIHETRGNVVANQPFDANWRRNQSPSILPAGVYTAGEAVFPNGVRVPYSVPLLDQGHAELPATEDGLRMVRSLLQRVQGDVDPRDLKIIVCDAWLGKLTADFAHRGDDLYRHVTQHGRAELLQGLEAEVAAINERVLRHWPSLRVQAANDPAIAAAGHREVPWRVVTLLGDGTPLSEGEAQSLARLTAGGPAAGLHFLIWNTPLPHGLENVTRVGDDVHVINPKPAAGEADVNAPAPLAVASISQEISSIVNKPLASPDYDTFRRLNAERVWSGSAINGLDIVVALDNSGRPIELELGDRMPHWYIGGQTGSGKSSFIMGALCQLAEKYDPSELEIYLMDYKGEGEQPAILAGSQRDPTFLPHCKNLGFGEGFDDEYSMAVLDKMEAEITRRSRLFSKAGVNDYKDYRTETGEKLPRILCVFDEIQKLVIGDLSERVIKRLNSLARTARSYGIHLVLGTQKMPDEHTLPGQPPLNEMLTQFPGRVALARSRGILDFDNPAAANIPPYHLVVNHQGGGNGANLPVARFANTDRARVVEAKRRIHDHMQQQGIEMQPPRVYNGARKPPLADDPAYQGLRPSEMRAPKGLIGKDIGLEEDGIGVMFSEDRGRNLTVYGRVPESVCDVLDATVLSLSKQHKQGGGTEATFRIVCTSNNPEMQDRAEAVAEKLGREGQKVQIYGRRRAGDAVKTVSEAVKGGRLTKEYLVIYGTEGATGVVDGDELMKVMSEGPQLGIHTLLTSSTPSTLSQALRGPNAFMDPDVRPLSDVWVATEVTAGDLAPLMDTGVQPPQWHGQPGRMIYYDKSESHKLGPTPKKLRSYETQDDD